MDQLKEQNIVEEVRKSFLEYSMSVITSRALPDLRDGLKPVHRRILYSMYASGITPDKPHKKSARIVGDVMGKFHPHGDSSIYEAMVRMAQDFSYRYMLVDGHGNFGNIEGYGAAAMRYTESRLSKISLELLRNINKDTVDFEPNFDELEQEPKVLPSRFPNILVNGTTGIAVGMATNIPPHNLGEVIDGCVAYIENPDIDVTGLMQYIKGPDFPTGATILGNSGIKKAYETGKGTITVRSKAHIEEKNGRNYIIIDEVPYGVNTSELKNKVAELVHNKVIEGISDYHSDLKDGIKITITLKKDANAQVVLNKLYKHTSFQTNYGITFLMLDQGVPKTLGLKDIIAKYIDFQKEVIIRRTRFDLNAAEKRVHILEGLKIALDNIDEINIFTVFEKTFFSGMSKKILEKLAYSILCNYVEAFMPPILSNRSLDYLKTNNILNSIVSIEEEHIEFKNGLVLEYCLASYLKSNNYIDLFLQNPTGFAENYLESRLPPALYNGIIRYISVNCDDFGKVVKLVCILLDNSLLQSDFVMRFINDIFRYMALYNEKKYVNDILYFDSSYSEYSKLAEFFIHSTCFMKDDSAYKVLTHFRGINANNYSLECNALINDRFSNGLRNTRQIKETKKYFETHIIHVLIPKRPLLSLFSLLWIMGRIGVDNTNRNIYHSVATLIKNQIEDLNYNLNAESILQVKETFLKYAYFIFFNADNNLEEKYYLYVQKVNLHNIIQHVLERKDLTLDELKYIGSLVDHFDETIEFFICNLIFMCMASYDLNYALKNLSALYKTFNDKTSVIELDFYSSALFLSNYIADPINRQLYLKYYMKMVDDFEMKMFISPSLERVASCRKFDDKFEIEFEDGFNILTDYTYTAPSENYITNGKEISIDSYLSLFWNLLDTLEQNGMYDEILQLIKAINQMSVNWPDEALQALSKFSRYSHPIIRKAVIRTLEENYLRYPVITTQFLAQTGEAFSEDELLKIFSATKSQIENRTLEQLQWGRMLFYIKEYLNPQIISDLLEIFLSSNTLLDVFKKITNSILNE